MSPNRTQASPVKASAAWPVPAPRPAPALPGARCAGARGSPAGPGIWGRAAHTAEGGPSWASSPTAPREDSEAQLTAPASIGSEGARTFCGHTRVACGLGRRARGRGAFRTDHARFHPGLHAAFLGASSSCLSPHSLSVRLLPDGLRRDRQVMETKLKGGSREM